VVLRGAAVAVAVVQIKARAEPGDEQVTVVFELTPPDASIGKYMVLCTTTTGKAIKSKKVGNPWAVIKGLTNGERYLFVVAVLDAARVRYDAPTTLSAVPGESSARALTRRAYCPSPLLVQTK
jgi:hypothetical protein